MKQFDYIIAGGGSAGLTLAFLLLVHENSKKSILIIDRNDKTANDRTWCFWEEGDNLLEDLVYKDWHKAGFYSSHFNHVYDISPYRYKMIRGIDFYQFMKTELLKYENLTWEHTEIKKIMNDGVVETKNQRYKADFIFNSTSGLKDFNIPRKHIQFLQHFKGKFIKTNKPCFDKSTMTYMDFRIDQAGDCRFGYVLPFSDTEALVEYTIFSETLLSTKEYEDGLNSYIRDSLNIENYTVLEEEFGVIPMTDFPFPLQNDRVINIGISGGFAKASTGYTFLRSQQILQKMASNLSNNRSPTDDLPYQSGKFKKYDSTLLKVLKGGKPTGAEVFSSLFEKNGAQAVFKFLDEETNLAEEIKIMSSTPIMAFGKAFLSTFS